MLASPHIFQPKVKPKVKYLLISKQDWDQTVRPKIGKNVVHNFLSNPLMTEHWNAGSYGTVAVVFYVSWLSYTSHHSHSSFYWFDLFSNRLISQICCNLLRVTSFLMLCFQINVLDLEEVFSDNWSKLGVQARCFFLAWLNGYNLCPNKGFLSRYFQNIFEDYNPPEMTFISTLS